MNFIIVNLEKGLKNNPFSKQIIKIIWSSQPLRGYTFQSNNFWLKRWEDCWKQSSQYRFSFWKSLKLFWKVSIPIENYFNWNEDKVSKFETLSFKISLKFRENLRFSKIL